jgi:hypothetical protein
MLRPAAALLITVVLTAVAYADTAKVPRPSRLHIDSATLITGSGAPVKLTNTDINLPPQELKNKRPTVIEKGIAFISAEGLTRLINDRITGSSLQNFKIETQDGQRAKISGSMKKAGLPVPVSIEGPLTLTSDGLLRLEIKSEKAAGIPIKALADAFGMSPEKSIKSNRSGAVRVEKDALLVDPNELLGTAQTRVVEARTSRVGLTLRFGSPQKKSTDRKTSPAR